MQVLEEDDDRVLLGLSGQELGEMGRGARAQPLRIMTESGHVLAVAEVETQPVAHQMAIMAGVPARPGARAEPGLELLADDRRGVPLLDVEPGRDDVAQQPVGHILRLGAARPRNQ